MSKHNYSQYSNNKKHENPAPIDPAPIDPEVVATPAVDAEPEVTTTPVVETKLEVKMEPKTTDGVVVNCAKLNVRAKPAPDADVVCVLDAASEIEINITDSTKDWYKVCIATGVEGYCMRKFINANL